MSANSLVEIGSIADSDLLLSLERFLQLSVQWERVQGHEAGGGAEEKEKPARTQPSGLASAQGLQWEIISRAVHSLRTNTFQYRVVKRVVDILIIMSCLPVLLPLFLVIALLVRLSSPARSSIGRCESANLGDSSAW